MAKTAPNKSHIRGNAVLLRDNPPGVLSDTAKRRIQNNHSYMVSLKSDFIRELNLDNQSAPTSHYFATGSQPVIITEPAIIIQPNGGELEREH